MRKRGRDGVCGCSLMGNDQHRRVQLFGVALRAWRTGAAALWVEWLTRMYKSSSKWDVRAGPLHYLDRGEVSSTNITRITRPELNNTDHLRGGVEDDRSILKYLWTTSVNRQTHQIGNHTL